MKFDILRWGYPEIRPDELRVLLNGKRVKSVVRADEAKGEVEIAILDADGHTIPSKDSPYTYLTATLRGQVRIIFLPRYLQTSADR